MSGTELEQDLKRGREHLQAGSWDGAKSCFERILYNHPKSAPSYIGELCAELKVQKEEVLAKSGKPFYNNENFKKAIRFADDEYLAKLKK